MIQTLHSRIFKFGVVGLSGMVIDFSVTWLIKEKLKLNKYLANSVGFSLAVVSNYLLNRNWTFEQISESSLNQFTKFLLVSLAGLAINNLCMILLVKHTKFNFYLLKIMVVALVFFWNYFINLAFTFN